MYNMKHYCKLLYCFFYAVAAFVSWMVTGRSCFNVVISTSETSFIGDVMSLFVVDSVFFFIIIFLFLGGLIFPTCTVNVLTGNVVFCTKFFGWCKINIS